MASSDSTIFYESGIRITQASLAFPHDFDDQIPYGFRTATLTRLERSIQKLLNLPCCQELLNSSLLDLVRQCCDFWTHGDVDGCANIPTLLSTVRRVVMDFVRTESCVGDSEQHWFEFGLLIVDGEGNLDGDRLTEYREGREVTVGRTDPVWDWREGDEVESLRQALDVELSYVFPPLHDDQCELLSDLPPFFWAWWPIEEGLYNLRRGATRAATIVTGLLCVDPERSIAVLHGQPYSVTRNLALMLTHLLDDGGWLSTVEIVERCEELDGVRLDREKRNAPPEIEQLIESKPGRGYRIQFP